MRGKITMGGCWLPSASQTVARAWLSAIPKAIFATMLAVAGTTAYTSAGGCGLVSFGSRGSTRTRRSVTDSIVSNSPDARSQVAAVGVSVTATAQPPQTG